MHTKAGINNVSVCVYKHFRFLSFHHQNQPDPS